MKMIGKNFKLGQFKFCLSFCPTWTRIMNDGAFTKKTCIINLEISTNLITMWGFLFWNSFFHIYLQIWPLHGKNTKPLELVEMLTTKTCNNNLEISKNKIKMNQIISEPTFFLFFTFSFTRKYGLKNSKSVGMTCF